MSKPFDTFAAAGSPERAALVRLFGAQTVTHCLDRLRFIYEYTEQKWRDYVAQIRVPVRYVMIAEAPPWSAEGPVQYVLDADSHPRTFFNALRAAFSMP